MASVEELTSGTGYVLAAFEAASRRLAGLKTVHDVADAALELALELTRSTAAFLAVGEASDDRRLFTRGADSADGAHATPMDATAAVAEMPTEAGRPWHGGAMPFGSPVKSYSGARLQAGGEEIGVIGVASPAGYTAVQQRSFRVFAHQVAAALEIALLNERKQDMVDALVNLRSEFDRSEKLRLVNEERAVSAEKVERAHEAAIEALLAVSQHASAGHSIPEFYALLTSSIAELAGARKVLFWQLQRDGVLAAIPGAYGVDDAFVGRLRPAACPPDGDGLTTKIVFQDQVLRASRRDEVTDLRYVLDALDVDAMIAVPWRAGTQRLGLVAVYDSTRPEGFTREDAWVLQKVGLAAGLVWQLKNAETDLKKTIDRLQKVDTSRQLLLKNVGTAVEKARRRIASELHDDALQKLTAAELRLRRLQDGGDGAGTTLAETQALLMQTEEALRRLLFEVRPPALDLPGGLEGSIRDRVALLSKATEITTEVTIDLPDTFAYEFKSMVFRQVSEALANVEKHAQASHVRVSVRCVDGAVHGVITDDGRGFVVSERNRLPGHLGLLALNERSILCGGWTKITSEPGLGTTVEFWMPVT